MLWWMFTTISPCSFAVSLWSAPFKRGHVFYFPRIWAALCLAEGGGVDVMRLGGFRKASTSVPPLRMPQEGQVGTLAELWGMRAHSQF